MANQTSGKDGKGRELVCSFCGRTQNEVEQLIIGPGVNICKDCLDMCNNALRLLLRLMRQKAFITALAAALTVML